MRGMYRAPSTCVMWGMAALWSPILHYDTDCQRLFLFYCESRKVRALNPSACGIAQAGADHGVRESLLQTLWCHYASGGEPGWRH